MFSNLLYFSMDEVFSKQVNENTIRITSEEILTIEPSLLTFSSIFVSMLKYWPSNICGSVES